MFPLPPVPPPHVVVRQAEASVVRALESYARITQSPTQPQQQYARNQQNVRRDGVERQRRDTTAQLRGRTRTSQRI